MQRPSWVTVVGILGIIFGFLGLFAGVYTAMVPKMLSTQQEMIKNMPTQTQNGMTPEMQASFEKMFKVDDSFRTWSVVFGLFGMLLNAAYAVAFILFITLKPYALRLVYMALGASITLTILRMIVLMSASSSMIAWMTGWYAIFGFLADVVLLIVVLVSDKSVFQNPAGAPAMPVAY